MMSKLTFSKNMTKSIAGKIQQGQNKTSMRMFENDISSESIIQDLKVKNRKLLSDIERLGTLRDEERTVQSREDILTVNKVSYLDSQIDNLERELRSEQTFGIKLATYLELLAASGDSDSLLDVTNLKGKLIDLSRQLSLKYD